MVVYISDRDDNSRIFNVECNDDGLWLNNNGNPDNRWNGNNRFVFRSRNLLHFSFVFVAREFCFTSCPFQPPSILPISSNGTDRAIYFLSSNDFVSHKTIKSILRVSVFLIANLIQGCFSSRERKVAIAIASIISTKIVSIFCPKENLCILGKV
jgi:hypothetical protein